MKFIKRPSSLSRYKNYKQAQKWVRELNLTSLNEWRSYIKGHLDLPLLPKDIPKNPDQTYKGKGWSGYAKFLGTKNKSPKKKYRIFKHARKFMNVINFKKDSIKDKMDWRKYVRDSKLNKDHKIIKKGKFKGLPVKPKDIPDSPDTFYKEFKSWGHFLWYRSQLAPVKVWRRYEEAKKFARSFNFKNQYEWSDYVRGKYKKLPLLPVDIPRSVFSVYRDKGWKGWGDFLGTGNKASFRKKYIPYSEAREILKKVGIKTQKDFKKWMRGEFKTKIKFQNQNIPCYPDRTYKDKSWKGWGDFLGTKNIQSQKTQILQLTHAFKLSQKIAKKYNLKTKEEWFKFFSYKKNKKILKENNIPTCPYSVYGDKFVKKGGLGKWLRK